MINGLKDDFLTQKLNIRANFIFSDPYCRIFGKDCIPIDSVSKRRLQDFSECGGNYISLNPNKSSKYSRKKIIYFNLYYKTFLKIALRVQKPFSQSKTVEIDANFKK